MIGDSYQVQGINDFALKELKLITRFTHKSIKLLFNPSQ
jgi:hypothetical protein